MAEDFSKLDRRDFVRLLTAGTAGEIFLESAAPAQAQTAIPEIVIVGGGMAGTTAAKYLSYWGKLAGLSMKITLIDRNASYISNILSNGVLVGERTIGSLTYSYTKLKSLSTAQIPISVITDEVLSLDPATRTVTLKGRPTAPITATRLILAPGIDFDYSIWDRATQSWSGATIQAVGGTLSSLPHAWDASLRVPASSTTTQTTLLQNQLKAMVNGNVVAIIIPRAPYRCPPGPYERACVIADWMKKQKPKSKVVILDANDGIIAEPINFGNAFGLNPGVKGIHAAYVQYLPKMTVTSIEFSGIYKTIKGVDGAGAAFSLTAEVVNLIPAMKGSALITKNFASDALSGGKWALVNELTYESTYYPGVHVIGDSIASKQPKAGHIGNQEGKICADAVLRLLTGKSFSASPMTNSACFTPITTKVGPSGQTATWLTALFRGQEVIDPLTQLPKRDLSGQKIYTMSMTSTKPYEPLNGASGDNFDSMTKWFTALMQDTSFV